MTRAADEFDEIGRRLAELDAERLALRQCTCKYDENYGRLHDSTCPAHGSVAATGTLTDLPSDPAAANAARDEAPPAATLSVRGLHVAANGQRVATQFSRGGRWSRGYRA